MIRVRINVLRAEKELQEGRKITFRDLTEETGLSMATINRILNGQSKQISFDTLNALCQYFGVGIGEVLEYVPDSKKPNSKK